ncbi:MAG: hypothetical protein ACP6IU_12095 [Candidatus Asgardarchaeia archaeon]
MNVISYIRKTYSHAVIKRCSESGCRLITDRNLGEYIILKGERLLENKKACDCILICLRNDKLTIGIIELKSRTTHVNEVVEKLYNCSEFVLSLIDDFYNKKSSIGYELIHIVLSKGRSSSEFQMMKNRKIKLKGRKYDIIFKNCNTSFSEIIKIFLP